MEKEKTNNPCNVHIWFTLEKTGEISNTNLFAIFLNKNPKTKKKFKICNPTWSITGLKHWISECECKFV